MANPFEVQTINPLQALLVGDQAYQGAQKRGQQQLKEQSAQEAAQRWQAGDKQGALALLLQGGNYDAASAYGNVDQRDYSRGRDVKQDARQIERDRIGDSQNAAYLRIAQANAARAGEAAARANDKTPSGFERDPATGGLRPMAGGPQDPNYIASATKPRSLSVSDIGKLSDEGQKFGTLTSVATNFKDNYGGYTPGTGDLNMTAGRYLPESVVGKDRAEGAAYWQEYDRYKNVVRNELFGSALTVGETKAFAQADVDPSMQPAQIRKNLARQKEIVDAGLKRKASAMIAAGYDPETIGRAYGIDLGGLGVNTQRRGGPAQPQGGSQPVRVTSPQQAKSLPSGTSIILPDGSPGVVP